MTRQDKITAAKSTTYRGNTGAAGVSSPGPSVAPTYSRCPDCNGPFSYRIRDDDTGCSYPVDDGEHYCGSCDALWTDEYLAETSLVEVEHLGPGRIAA